MTLSHLDILYGREEQLFDVLKERYDHNLCLKKLVVRSCRMHEDEDESRFEEVVEEVEWDDVIVVEGLNLDRDSDSDGEGVDLGVYLHSDPDDIDVCEKYHQSLAE